MEFHFFRPYWFLALLPVGGFCWLLARQSIANNWRQVCDAHLLPYLLVLPQRNYNTHILLFALGCFLAIFALAGPSWEQQYQPIYRSMVGRILVLNLSPSMSDSVGTTKKIDRARYKLLDYLRNQREGLTGLVVYSDEAYTISPLTEDNRTIANFVPSLDPTIMPTFNDNTVVGLEEAEKLLKQAGLLNGDIILVTDKLTNYSKTEQKARELLDEGYRTIVFNISPLSANTQQMKKLAVAGGGKLVELAPNNTDVETLLASTKGRSFMPPTTKTKEKGMVWQDNGRLIVFLVLPFALLAFRRGYL